MAGSEEVMMMMEMKGSFLRIKSCAFDLIDIGGELMTEEFEDVDDELLFWDLIQRELGLKATFLYLDFAKFISLVKTTDQETRLTSLANRLFDSIEEVDNAAKERSIELTRERYLEALVVLREVIDLMP